MTLLFPISYDYHMMSYFFLIYDTDFITAQKRNFSVNVAKPQFPADFVTFTVEIFIEKLLFLCTVLHVLMTDLGYVLK